MTTRRSRKETAARRARTILIGALSLLIVGILAFPVAGSLVVGLAHAAPATGEHQTNPRANYWRAVRGGDDGTTTASGPYTVDVLIQNGGENWRQLRNGLVTNIGAWVLAAILVLIALFHLLIGPQRVEGRLSGDRMPRWSVGERIMHWYTAILFIILAVTGLSLLFGRAVLIPVLGLEGFGAYAQVAKSLHSYVGPFFLAGVLVEVVVWMRDNAFTREDWQWLVRFGGSFGGGHTHAGRTNGGEKVWFWFIAIFGLVGVGVSGLIMDFPIFGQSRATMQIANLIHASLGILWLGIALGHIYIGTLGTPGAIDGMVKGHVSKEWMRTHHDRWYEKLAREGKVGSAAELEGRERGSEKTTPRESTS